MSHGCHRFFKKFWGNGTPERVEVVTGFHSGRGSPMRPCYCKGKIYLGHWEGRVTINTIARVIYHEYHHHILHTIYGWKVSRAYDKLHKLVGGQPSTVETIRYGDGTVRLFDNGGGMPA